MTVLAWDGLGDKVWETGVDRGVLYLEDGTGVPWNGLTAVEDRTNSTTTPLYWDGVKFNDIVVVGDFVGSLKAYTYPDEFMEYEGIQEVNAGLYVTGQTPKMFGLSWRTKIGNDVSQTLGYKIHICSNLTDGPTTRAFKTNSDTMQAVEFEWLLSAIPSYIPGYRHTPHLMFDTSKSTPEFIADIEAILYGSDTTDPELPPLENLVYLASSLTP
jgi:hypothetical protein